jgi:predicted amidohydrolase YtcJ
MFPEDPPSGKILEHMKTLLLLLVVTRVALADDASKADLVLRNGIVHTLDSAQPKAEAIAIAGNRILAVGSDSDVDKLVAPATRVVDLHGATVIPGFTESHGHLMSLGESRLSVDLTGTKSWPEIVASVAVETQRMGKSAWIYGRGWHESKWTLPPSPVVRGFPTHDALSAVTPDNPVVLERADGHAYIVNAKVMSLMGIDHDTRAPEGGEVIKDADGLPTGVLVDNAMNLVRLPPSSDARRSLALDLALAESLRKGLTSFDDAGASAEDLALFKRYANEHKLGPRLYVMVMGYDLLKTYDKPEIGLGDGFLTIRSVKLVADGAMGSRGAALLEPYDDGGPRSSGFLTTPPEIVLATARYGLEHGFQVNVHAIGDRTNRMVLDQFEKAFAEHPEVKDPRFRIEHAQILDAADIPRFAKLGVIASMQGIHCTSDRPWAESRIGIDRVKEGLYVWRKLLDSGATIINGTDVPVRNYYASVTRKPESGGPPEGFDPDQRMTRDEALVSYTLAAARGAFEEKERGSVETGKLADLTVLSQDILNVPDATLLKTRVLYTIVDGRIRYDAAAPPHGPNDRP